MLADKEAFDILEQVLTERGLIENFEKENGKILGRMMIIPVDIPEEIEITKLIPGKFPQGFEASFDFYDSAIGIALYTETMTVASKVWITPQREGAEVPSEDWVKFFVEKLAESIKEDGSYGYPIYSFVNDTCDMTIVPTKPSDGFERDSSI